MRRPQTLRVPHSCAHAFASVFNTVRALPLSAASLVLLSSRLLNKFSETHGVTWASRHSPSKWHPECRYFDTTRRYAYTTPKSYLELISLYKSLLAKQRAELAENKTRLENGVEKIAQASRQVADLQVRTPRAQY